MMNDHFNKKNCINEISLVTLGGCPDGVYDNSEQIANAMANLKNSGGGILRIGKGIWRTGPFEIFSGITLALEEGAVLSFIPEPKRYRPVLTRWEGVECYAMHPCIFAEGQENISIIGKGILDGSGKYWWDMLSEKRKRGQINPETPEELELAGYNTEYKNQPNGGGGRNMQFLRPPLLQFLKCRSISLEGITLQNSPFWTVHPVFCSDIKIDGLVIKNPPDAPNTDGIDIDSCEDVIIKNCHVSVGDDGIVLKSGSGEDGLRAGKPCRRISVYECTVEDGHGGIVIGSETAAGIKDVFVENCIFRGTDRGIRIKTRRGRGGRIENLEFKNLIMENNLCPIAINMFYRCGANDSKLYFSQEALPVDNVTPSIRNINIMNIRASGCRASAGFIAGLPESPVENLSVLHCEFFTDEKSGISPDESEMYLGLPSITEKCIRLLNVKNAVFNDVLVHGPAETFIYR